MSDAIVEFLARYPNSVARLAMAVRALILRALPDLDEVLDEPGGVIGFGLGPGYSGLVCTIIPSKTGVRLGIVRGAELPDPLGLLEGTGKRHRYVQFSQPADVGRPGIEELLVAARTAASSKRA